MQSGNSSHHGGVSCRNPLDYRGSRILVWGKQPVSLSNQCLTTQLGPSRFSNCDGPCQILSSASKPVQPRLCRQGLYVTLSFYSISR